MSYELSQGLEKAPCRALLKAAGFTGEQLQNPVIAVLSPSGDMSAASDALKRITDAVRISVFAGGCTPIVIPITTMNGGMAFGGRGVKYALPMRELIADNVESVLSAYPFDGAVLCPDGDIAAAGMLMGAARVNIPTAFVSCGSSYSGKVGGKPVGLASVIEGVGKVNGGKLSLDELTALEETACPSGGSSNGMYGGNTMACVLEALGMALAGNGTLAADNASRTRLASKTGAAVCALVRDAIVPRMIMTKRAITNALTFVLATGGSTNAILNLLAVAAECNVAVNLDFVQKLSDVTPTLCALFPFSDRDIRDFEQAGGVQAVLHELAKLNLIDGSAHTVGGDALASDYDHAHVTDANTIRKADAPLHKKGGAVLLRGTLAEDGALAMRAGMEKQTFVGKAKCFDSEDDAVAAIVAGRVQAGDAVIVRYEGPIGGPGMRELTAVTAAITGMGLDGSVLLITDGRLPDTTRCAAIGHVCPEAADGGKIALAKDGDTVKLDLGAGRINLDVPAKELQARQKKLRPRDPNATGMLLRYQNLVTSAMNGATLKKKF